MSNLASVRGDHHDSSVTGSPRIVALIDPKPLRRCFVLRFLESAADAPIIAGGDIDEILRMIAAQGELAKEEGGVREPLSRGESAAKVGVVIINLGGDSLTEMGAARSLVQAIATTFPEAALVAFSDVETRREIVAAMSLGVHGFIPTSMQERVVWPTIKLVQAGGQYAPMRSILQNDIEKGGAGSKPASKSRGEITEKAEAVGVSAYCDLGDFEIEDAGCEGASLSPREVEVLNHVSHGLQNKQIAYSLGMSESTVKVHVRNIMKKLAVTNRTQAAFRARTIAIQAQMDMEHKAAIAGA